MNPVTVSKHGHTRFWAVRDGAGQLICVCVYKRGALEVARRLGAVFSYDLRDASSFHETAPAFGRGTDGSLPPVPQQPE